MPQLIPVELDSSFLGNSGCEITHVLGGHPSLFGRENIF